MEEREKKVLKPAVITGLNGKFSFCCSFAELHFAISRKCTGTRAKIYKKIFAARINVAMSRKIIVCGKIALLRIFLELVKLKIFNPFDSFLWSPKIRICNKDRWLTLLTCPIRRVLTPSSKRSKGG